MYLDVNDLLESTARYPGLFVPDSLQDGDVLEGMISDAGDLLDRATGDHFSPTPGPVDDDPEETVTIVVDGPTPDGFGRSGRILLLPRRVRSVAAVSTIATDGTTLSAFDASTYRVHSSLIDPAATDTPVYFGSKGYDGIEFLYGPADDSVSYPGWNWFSGSFPSYPRSIAVEGTFDWGSTPEPVKQATAWLVVAWAKPRQTPPRTGTMNSGRVTIDLNQDGYTGISEVDRVIRQYKRPALGLIPV